MQRSGTQPNQRGDYSKLPEQVYLLQTHGSGQKHESKAGLTFVFHFSLLLRIPFYTAKEGTGSCLPT